MPFPIPIFSPASARRWVAALLLGACLPAGALAAEAAAEGNPVALAAQAVAANPGVAAMQARVAELDNMARVAGTWPDPQASIELSNLPVTTWGLADHPMAGLQLVARQTVPFPGVTGLRRDVVRAQVAVAEAAVAEAQLRLARAVEEGWWRLALVRQLRAVTEQHIQLTDQLLEVVRARYETGATGQSALLRLQVQRDKLADEVGEFQRQERQISVALAAALHADGATPFQTPENIEALAPVGEPADWLAQASEQRPALAEQREMARGAELAAHLARVDARPDVTLWAGYRLRTVTSDMDPGTDLVSVGLSLPVPLASARVGRGAESAAHQAASAARERQDALLDSIAAELGAAAAAWGRAASKAEVYQDHLLPAARLALDSTLSDYRVDRADFASLNQAQVQLLDLERARLVAVAETHLQAAAVRAITGSPAPAGVTP